MIETIKDEIHYVKNQYQFYSLESILTFNKITVTIKDYRDWVIYSKQFSSISDEVGLTDMHYALYHNLHPKPKQYRNDDNIMIQVKQNELGEQNVMKPLKIQNRCGFITQKQGKVRVFTILYSFQDKKDIEIQTSISLERKRKMTTKQKQLIMKRL